MTTRRPPSWAAMLALPLLVAACTQPSQPQPISAANADKAAGADRQAHFAQSPKKLDTCVTWEVHQALPDRYLILNIDPPETLHGLYDQVSDVDAWTIEFHESGSGSDVILRNINAPVPEISHVWRIVEACAVRSWG